MNIEYKEQELLEQIKQGDRAAAETWLSLLTFQSYRMEQIPAVLCAAAIGLKEVRGKDKKTEIVFSDLARLAAYKMYDHVPVFKNRLLAHFSNPDSVSEKELSESLAATEILLTHRLIKNAGVFDIADAIAEGLHSTHDREKTGLLNKAGSLVIDTMPGGEGSDMARIYWAIFKLAEVPNSNPKCTYNCMLNSKITKLESGDPNIAREMGNERDRIMLRIYWAMNLQPKPLVLAVKEPNPDAPLSDGDANLKNPMAGRKQKNGGLISTIASIGSKLAKKEPPKQANKTG